MPRTFNSRSGSRDTYGLQRHYRGILTIARRPQPAQTMQQTPLRRLMSRVARALAAALHARNREQRRRTAEASRRDAAEDQSKIDTPTIPDLDDRIWLPRAQPISDFICDAGFWVAGRFTNLREPDANGRRECVVLAEVGPPELPQRLPGYILTADISGQTAELAGYYRRLITAAAEVGLTKELRRTFPHFRVQPIIAASTELTEFPYYDSVVEATQVLRGIADSPLDIPEPHEILDDLDQGWRGRLAAWRGRIGVIEWDWEETHLPPTAGFSFDGLELARQAKAALQRLGETHRDLVQALGRDYWSY
jgi:hypothetical protein